MGDSSLWVSHVSAHFAHRALNCLLKDDCIVNSLADRDYVSGEMAVILLPIIKDVGFLSLGSLLYNATHIVCRCHLAFLFFNPHLRTFFHWREGERERERHTHTHTHTH